MEKLSVTTLLVAGLAGSLLTPTSVAAEAGPHSLTANLTLTSSYRSRGIDQSYGKPALQGGFDYAHASGFYLGNWNSNISSGAGYPDGNLEMDFYGGYKTGFGDFALDVGGAFFYYPGSEGRSLGWKAKNGAVKSKEIYVAGSWKFLTLKYSYSIDDYFALRGIDAVGTETGKNTRGSAYFELNADYALGNGWGINAHMGHLDLKNVYNGDYTDWKIGVTKDIGGWVVGLSYVDTDASGKCSGASSYQPYCVARSLRDDDGVANASSSTKDAGRGIVLFSVSRVF
ncbi:MAG: TorF family putative porin [Candidatus Accumulibacter sp.]|jgi:uncharacterized protein (TIGR02001 family)|nr:TorF family putative porin [Accumulibacter sp.]